MERKSGVLMHVSSLFGDYSIGSFGNQAKYFVDFLKDAGFTYWQVLPFCMVDECNSPYKSYSAFGGNPYFVDLEILKEKGLLSNEELSSQRQMTPYSCEYVRLYHTRTDVLRKAAMRVTDREKVESFIDERPYIKKFCEFMALKTANNQAPWNEWTVSDIDDETLFMWKFVQYEFFMQWSDIKEYANSKGIKIIGDIPIYVSYDSCDVWSNRELFELDDNYKPASVAGVPPDYFSEDGQLWGNPLYNWDKMKSDGYKWWCDRLLHMFEMFDGVRIDHFRAFESYWSVPSYEKTARNGKWIKGPGMELIDKLKEIAGDKLIIAEDLGDLSEDVINMVANSGLPGMRVFQFAFLSDDNNTHLPHNYIKNSVAYSGTHDNNTLLGYLWELDDNTRKRMLDYCGYTDSNWEAGMDSIIKTIFRSSSDLCILPIQDILGYGSDTRLNIPGKADGNWQYRLTKEQIDNIDKEKFRHFNSMYKR